MGLSRKGDTPENPANLCKSYGEEKVLNHEMLGYPSFRQTPVGSWYDVEP